MYTHVYIYVIQTTPARRLLQFEKSKILYSHLCN